MNLRTITQPFTQMIKNQHIMGSNYNSDNQMLLAHPQDIAAAIATELQSEGNGIEVKYIVSDMATGNEIAAPAG